MSASGFVVAPTSAVERLIASNSMPFESSLRSTTVKVEEEEPVIFEI